MGYGYASTASLPGATPMKQPYGYSGAGAYRPSGSNSGGGLSTGAKMAIAGVGGVAAGVLLTGAYYSYANRPSRYCQYGESWTGSCKSCYDRYPAEACQEQPPQLPAARDDLMACCGFAPADFQSPIRVTLSYFSGAGYSPTLGETICPPRNWNISDNTWSPSATSDVYLSLTMVDALADPHDGVTNGQLRCCDASTALGAIMALRLFTHPFL